PPSTPQQLRLGCIYMQLATVRPTPDKRNGRPAGRVASRRGGTPMNRRTGLVVPLALALPAVLVAGGCSRGDAPPPAGGAAAPSTAAPATSASAAPTSTAGDP